MTDTKLFKILEEDYWKGFQHYRDSFNDTFIYLPSKDPEELIKLTNNCFGNDTAGNAQSFNWHSPLFIYTDSIVIESDYARPQQKVLDKMRRGYTAFINLETCNTLNKSGFGFYFYLDDLHPNVNLYYQKSNGKNCRNAFIIVFEINNKFGGAVLLQLSHNNNTPHNFISWGLAPEILRNPNCLENNVYRRTVKYIKSSMYHFENKLFQRYSLKTEEARLRQRLAQEEADKASVEGKLREQEDSNKKLTKQHLVISNALQTLEREKVALGQQIAELQDKRADLDVQKQAYATQFKAVQAQLQEETRLKKEVEERFAIQTSQLRTLEQEKGVLELTVLDQKEQLEYANEQNTKKLKEDLKIVGWFEDLPKQKIVNYEFDLISL